MASWMVHLRIADELLKKINGLDETAFVVGNIAPDNGVPNSDWTEFRPPKTATHFQKKTDSGRKIDTDAFLTEYFNADVIGGYSSREYSFFLGYYVHLLTDIRWIKTIIAGLKNDFPKEYAEDKNGLIQAAKEDWYDIDFLFLEQHPDFRAFAVYENAAGFENDFMEMFERDAFENRRQYICGFYHSAEHGELHREFRYLTPECADSFVKDTSKLILEQLNDPFRKQSADQF